MATSQTLLLLFLKRPLPQIRWAAVFASLFALTRFLHVGTWFAIGVVTAVTFILLTLGSICLAINFSAIAYPLKHKKELDSLLTLRFQRFNKAQIMTV